GEESRFAFQYVLGNLEGARAFFLSLSAIQPNSFWLVLLGTAGTGWAMIPVWQTRSRRATGSWSPATAVTALFGLTIAANLGLLMFYYWSRLDEPVTARFALPMFLILS